MQTFSLSAPRGALAPTGTTRRRAMRVLVVAMLGLMLAGPGLALAGATKVDVNTASVEQLAALPGIGATKAAAIVEERKRKAFGSVDDLERVTGIGPKTLSELRSQVRVGSGR